MNLAARAKALYNLFKEGGLTRSDKVILVLAVLYCLSPIDLVPDVVPALGFIDDLLVVLLSLRQVTGNKSGKTTEPDAVHVDAKVV